MVLLFVLAVEEGAYRILEAALAGALLGLAGVLGRLDALCRRGLGLSGLGGLDGLRRLLDRLLNGLDGLLHRSGSRLGRDSGGLGLALDPLEHSPRRLLSEQLCSISPGYPYNE